MQKRTKIIGSIIILLVVGAAAFSLAKNGKKQSLETQTLQRQDLRLTSLASGKVTSGTDLSLSFQVSGVVSRLPAVVGKQVEEGDVLVEIENREQRAQVLQAQGALAQARASLQKVLDGASGEDVLVAQAAVDSAKVTLENSRRSLEETVRQQKQLVDNAWSVVLNGGLAAEADVNNISSVQVSVTGTYTGTSGASFKLGYYQAGSGPRYTVEGPGGQTGQLSAGSPLPLNDSGLFITFSAVPSPGSDTWTVAVPNTKSSAYITNLNAYTAAKRAAEVAVAAGENAVAANQAAVEQAVAALNAKKAAARPADIRAAEAQVTSAAGQLAAAQASFENTILRAPARGTVTAIDIKLGELATSQSSVITLQDVDNLYVEANISEANITNLKIGQKVEYVFDALGDREKFDGEIISIDPSSTLVSGIVNYKIKASVLLRPVEQGVGNSIIRPGMTTNMTIVMAERKSALSLPAKAVISRDGQKYIRILTNSEKQSYEERPVEAGLEADGGLIEILSGVSEGDSIVISVADEE